MKCLALNNELLIYTKCTTTSVMIVVRSGGVHKSSACMALTRTHTSNVAHNPVQFSSVHFTSIQFNSIQFNSIQFNSIQFNSIQFNSIQFNSIQFNSIQFKGLQSTASRTITELNSKRTTPWATYIGLLKDGWEPQG